MVGFACGAAFALGLTLPPLLSKPEEVAHVAAAMFTISYGATVVVLLLRRILGCHRYCPRGVPPDCDRRFVANRADPDHSV